jgi:hypothetical protein
LTSSTSSVERLSPVSVRNSVNKSSIIYPSFSSTASALNDNTVKTAS